MFFIAFIIGKGYNLDKFIILIQEDFPMRKTVTGILLATSVLAMATVQQVQAAESGATSALTTSTVKEVHYVAFQNGRLVDIKAALTGSAVTDASIKDQPKIENYKYTTSEEMDGILYHTYAPADTTATTGNSNSSSAQSNPYHGGNTAATTNTNTNNNQNTTTTSGNSAVKEVRFVVYKEGSSDPVNIKDPRKGSEASDTSHPTIANYEYVTGNLKDGILYHVYRSNTATNAGNNNQNQSTTTSGGQFKTENGKVYYIKDGKKVSGWQKIDDKTY